MKRARTEILKGILAVAMSLPLVLVNIDASGQAPLQPSAPAVRHDSPMIMVDAHEDTIDRVLDHGDDLGQTLPHTQADLAKWKAGGVNVVWFAVWVDPEDYPGTSCLRRAAKMIQALHQQCARHPELVLCDTAADCRAAVASHKIAALLGLEGGALINDNLSMIEHYRREHVRYMTLTWRGNLDWAGSSQSRDPSKGLTDFGRQVVREMNRVGMIVDLSHVSDHTFYDAIAVSTKPVIVSHSNCRALANHPRNVTDDMLRALKKNGGVIGITFWRDFLGHHHRRWSSAPQINPTIETVLDQIDHAVKIAGVDHVGIGSDYEGDIEPAIGLEDASCMSKLMDGLRKRGYSEEDVRKIAGENFLRVLKANESLPSATSKPPAPR